jgi:hypothetical protein
MTEPQIDDLFHQCSWCGNTIQEDEDYYGFGAKASNDVNLEDKAGQFVSLKLSLIEKTVVALVPSELGAPELDGHDLVFITCSEDCASSLKEALDLERDVFHDEQE